MHYLCLLLFHLFTPRKYKDELFVDGGDNVSLSYKCLDTNIN